MLFCCTLESTLNKVSYILYLIDLIGLNKIILNQKICCGFSKELFQ